MCIVSGGNIDSGRLSRTIQRGLGSSGRLMRFAVPILDHRGGLEQLAKTISEESAVLKSLVTEQVWVHSDVGTTWVFMILAYFWKILLNCLFVTSQIAIYIGGNGNRHCHRNM